MKWFPKCKSTADGIIEYAHEVKEKGLESKFIGKNFVFDKRLGEKSGKTLFPFVISVNRLAIITLTVKMMLAIFYLFSAIDVLKF